MPRWWWILACLAGALVARYVAALRTMLELGKPALPATHPPGACHMLRGPHGAEDLTVFRGTVITSELDGMRLWGWEGHPDAAPQGSLWAVEGLDRPQPCELELERHPPRSPEPPAGDQRPLLGCGRAAFSTSVAFCSLSGPSRGLPTSRAAAQCDESLLLVPDPLATEQVNT